MDYSNNGFESSGILNASSNSISIDLSPGNTISRDHNSGDIYGYVSKIDQEKRVICTEKLTNQNIYLTVAETSSMQSTL